MSLPSRVTLSLYTGSGSQPLCEVFETGTHELPLGQYSSGQSVSPQVEELPQIRRQRCAPPWMGLHTVSAGQPSVLPSPEHGAVQ